MNLFSISELQKFSGIKAHTIRAWEMRYGALKPERSEGNTRYYNGDQLKRLLNIVSLMDSEYKISELCSMSDKMLGSLLEKKYSIPSDSYLSAEYFIAQLISTGLEFNENKFDKLFATCIIRYGLKNTYLHVIYPVLDRMGLMWSNNTLMPAHEHFITNLIRQKLLAATDALPPSDNTENCWLLFLPENEFHETGLLISNYLIRQASKKVIYLGANVPFDNLKQTVREIKPDSLLLFLIRNNDNDEDYNLVRSLRKNFPDKNLYIACNKSRLSGLKTSEKVFLLHSQTDLETILN